MKRKSVQRGICVLLALVLVCFAGCSSDTSIKNTFAFINNQTGERICLGQEIKTIKSEIKLFSENMGDVGDLYLEFKDGKITALNLSVLDKSGSVFSTADGIKIGDLRSKVLEIYGDPTVVGDYLGLEYFYFYKYENGRLRKIEADEYAEDVKVDRRMYFGFIKDEDIVTSIDMQSFSENEVENYV